MADYDTQIVAVVDDDESLRRSLRNLLGSVGFRVETFASAEAFNQPFNGNALLAAVRTALDQGGR